MNFRRFKFNPASRGEDTVFGAERPGYNSKSVRYRDVSKWISFMKANHISRVCCLLSPNQLAYYDHDLLHIYRRDFGVENLLWEPITDFHLCDAQGLTERILPFLVDSDAKKECTVVHCSGGSGRTGHVLAGWLVHGRKFAIEDALKEVSTMGRNPWEAVYKGNATKEDLYLLMQHCIPSSG